MSPAPHPASGLDGPGEMQVHDNAPGMPAERIPGPTPFHAPGR